MGKPKKGERIKITIDNLAYGGAGVGRYNDFVVFVEGALPEEVVVADVYKSKSNYAEARLVQIESESPYRIAPRCRHFPTCGGCRLQHLEYQKQTEYKRQQLIDALRQIGKIDNPPVSKLIPSKQQFYYRNKMEYSFGLNYDNEPSLGLHPRGRFGRVFDLRECFLQSPESAAIVPAIGDAVRESNLPIYDIKKHIGLWRYLTIREGKNTNQRMLNFVTSKPAEDEILHILEKAFPSGVAAQSVVNNINSKKASIAYGESEILISGEDHIIEETNGIKFKISANSFFQTNSLTSGLLFEKIISMADCRGDENALDLYCGTGSISLNLAKRVKKVIGVDSEVSAIENAKTNRELNGIENCDFYVADSLDYLLIAVSEDSKFDIVVADPPRVGLHPEIIPLLGRIAPSKLIYVSCNPPALARDYIGLSEVGYELENVICVDMFPQTPHIEAIALFSQR